MPLGQAVLASAGSMSPGNIVLSIIGIIAIIVAAYYITYFLGSRTFKLRSGRNIILRDRFAVSKDKSFFVIEAYGKVYIVGVTNHSMTVIDTLDAEENPVFQTAEKRPATAPGQGGVRQRMVNGMAEFIRAHILKRGDGVRYDRGGDFGSIYKKTMSDVDDENQTGTEDEE